MNGAGLFFSLLIFLLIVYVAWRSGLSFGAAAAFLILLYRMQPKVRAIQSSVAALRGWQGSLDEVEWLMTVDAGSGRGEPGRLPCPALTDGISFEEAASIMLQGMTVEYLFHRTWPLEKGQTVLFHAAAGGVGLLACQWARSEGIELIGTAGTDAKCKLALDMGASHCINYRETDFAPEVKKITGDKGVDIVMDGVGKDTFDASLDCLKPLGMMMSFGNASGPVEPVSLLTLASKGSLKMTRTTLFTFLADHDRCQAMAKHLFEKVESGDVKTNIGQRYKLEDIAEAHRALEARETTGSTIITL